MAPLIHTRMPGYVLLEPETADAVRFRRPARDGHQQALDHARMIEDREQEAGSLDGLANAHARSGAVPEARRLWSAALRIYEELNMPDAAEVRRRLLEL